MSTNNQRELMCVQEVVTHLYIVSYCIKWVTTSWAYSIVPKAILEMKTVNSGIDALTVCAYDTGT